jgi:TctA family transporter
MERSTAVIYQETGMHLDCLKKVVAGIGIIGIIAGVIPGIFRHDVFA